MSQKWCFPCVWVGLCASDALASNHHSAWALHLPNMELSHWKTRFTSFQDEFAYVWLNKNKISRIEWGLALGLAFGMRRGFRMSKHAAKEMLKTLPKPPAAGTPERYALLRGTCCPNELEDALLWIFIARRWLAKCSSLDASFQCLPLRLPSQKHCCACADRKMIFTTPPFRLQLPACCSAFKVQTRSYHARGITCNILLVLPEGFLPLLSELGGTPAALLGVLSGGALGFVLGYSENIIQKLLAEMKAEVQAEATPTATPQQAKKPFNAIAE